MPQYRIRHLHRRNGREVEETRTVEAATAVEAAYAAARQDRHVGQFASLTSRHQRAGDPAVRDNAYAQTDPRGYTCYVAERVEAVELLARLDAKSREVWRRGREPSLAQHAEFESFMASLCGLSDETPQDALGAAGYARHEGR